jgi:hypothetical protein
MNDIYNSLKTWTHTRHLDQIKFRQGYWSYVLQS